MPAPNHLPRRRVAVITGAGRPTGIAAAVGRRLAPSHDLLLTGLSAYDEAKVAADHGPMTELLGELERLGARAEYLDADLTEHDAPSRVISNAAAELGRVDVLIAAHAHSTPTSLGALEAGEIDRHLAVNVRATLLLADAFVQARDPGQGPGRIVLFSSGQRLGPMASELAYAASKGGVEALVPSLSDALADAGITVNAINPGPTDTGWLSGSDYEAVRARFPSGRWGEPDDAARAVAWLVSEEAAWITGQVLDSEGGFRR